MGVGPVLRRQSSGTLTIRFPPGSRLAAMIGQMPERRRAERLDTELDKSRAEFVHLIGHEVRAR
ncbi:hypothetical protein GCM10010201_24910 [Pilimelia columellifera subsp. columellifera]|uniref:Uncharacterized protein n=1 Tax=Pilimelia columellifera subsp. columellifera TaxID=706583 RepID=A0ABP6AWD7_9ACTN